MNATITRGDRVISAYDPLKRGKVMNTRMRYLEQVWKEGMRDYWLRPDHELIVRWDDDQHEEDLAYVKLEDVIPWRD